MPSPDQERLESLSESVMQLLRRQNELEKRLALLEGERPVLATPETEPARTAETEPVFNAAEPPTPVVAAAPQQPATLRLQTADVPLETKVGLTLINRMGVITLVLGVAFFFKWAVDNNWIGPSGRVMLGILAGLLTLGTADVLWRNGQRAFAQGITGAGVAVLYLSFYSAFGFYHLIPQPLAFLLMCCITGLAFALSLRYDSAAVTALGLLGGYLTPLLLSSGDDHPWFLFSYLLLLDSAAVALAKKRNWKLLEMMSVVATALIYGWWLLELPEHTKQVPASAALCAFYILYYRVFNPSLFLSIHVLAALALSNLAQDTPALFFPLSLVLAAGGLAYAERNRFPHMLSGAFGSFWLSYALYKVIGHGSSSVLYQFALITAVFLLFFIWNFWLLARKHAHPSTQRLSLLALNGIVYYAAAYFQLEVIHHSYLGLLAVALAGAYLALGVFLYQRRDASGENRPLLLSLGMALAFATLAIPIQFTGFTITVAWSFEAAVLSWIGWRVRDARAGTVSVLIFALVGARLLFIDSWMLPDPRAYSLLGNERFFTFAVASASLFLAARWSVHLSRTIALWEYFGAHFVLLWGSSLEIIAWVERSMQPLDAVSAETLSLSILYGLYGLILVSAGVATRTAVNRIAGLILIGLVIAKLYLFDVWQLSRPYRISAFIALGILLISTSFLYSRFRPLIESLLREDETPS